MSTPMLSIIIPIYNEMLNVNTLALEIIGALKNQISNYEIVFINDGSTDETATALNELVTAYTSIRFITHKKNYGQSIAVITGVKHAKGEWIATLDGDGQNDPNDIVKLIEIAMQQHPQKNILIAGHRQKRQDNWSKKISTKIANTIRSKLLKDNCPDTGCGLKVFQRDFFLSLPHFNHMHRFLPALTRRAGGKIINVPVNHRPRMRGQSKYGIWNRLWVGIDDLLGVAWLIRRGACAEIIEIANNTQVTHTKEEVTQ